MHLLREKLVASKSRIVFVSSGAVTSDIDPSKLHFHQLKIRLSDSLLPFTDALEDALKSGAGTAEMGLYSMTKFVQLLGAHWWRRELTGVCDVVAVSPGLVPGTGLARGSGIKLPTGSPAAKTIPEGTLKHLRETGAYAYYMLVGAQSMIAALTRSDFPEDPDRIFLTSWGEWWDKAVFEKTLDKKLQDKWSFSKEDIEKEAGISA